MSFDESVFLAGFNQKTAKEDLFVKGNHEMTWEDSRRLLEALHQSGARAPDMWA